MPTDSHEARIDKFLWAVRFFKTRTLATQACKAGRINLNGRQAKPSFAVRAGDTLDIKRPPVTYTIRVLQPIQNRVGAKLLPDIIEDLTSPAQYELMEMQRISGLMNRARGTGRPTKKERRDLTQFLFLDGVDDGTDE